MLCSSDSIQSFGRYPAKDATYGRIWEKVRTGLNHQRFLHAQLCLHPWDLKIEEFNVGSSKDKSWLSWLAAALYVSYILLKWKHSQNTWFCQCEAQTSSVTTLDMHANFHQLFSTLILIWQGFWREWITLTLWLIKLERDVMAACWVISHLSSERQVWLAYTQPGGARIKKWLKLTMIGGNACQPIRTTYFALNHYLTAKQWLKKWLRVLYNRPHLWPNSFDDHRHHK